MTASIATNAPTRFVDVGGTRFAYRRFGTAAGTPVVFVQHFMGNLDNFDPAISDALAPGREVILFDNAGVGSSTGTAPDTVAAMAADAAGFIDGLGLATVDLLGHSMGGEVAQQIALDRPDLVRRLVLVGTGPRGGVLMTPDTAQLFAQRPQDGLDMWLPIMFSPSKESQAAGRAFISRSRIAQPALVVNGNDDIVIPTINSYTLYQNLPNAELMLYPDANHDSHFQYPARFARRVIDFLDVEPGESAG